MFGLERRSGCIYSGAWFMHELAICRAIVESALAELERAGHGDARLVRTTIVAGEFRQIVPDFLCGAYEILTRGTPAEGSKLEVRSAPIIGECGDCGWRGRLAVGEFWCASCESVRIELVGGMELHLESIELETKD